MGRLRFTYGKSFWRRLDPDKVSRLISRWRSRQAAKRKRMPSDIYFNLATVSVQWDVRSVLSFIWIPTWRRSSTLRYISQWEKCNTSNRSRRHWPPEGVINVTSTLDGSHTSNFDRRRESVSRRSTLSHWPRLVESLT